ncbi:MAG: hypothetical protein PWP23_2874 [Candidatus Sumerlaeota bacterium]|nr:hypothetical protein [Candidatus Sumerlaeota bacterium]
MLVSEEASDAGQRCLFGGHRARLALGAACLFALFAVAAVSLTPRGQLVDIDEAIYICWGLRDLPVPADWIGMKPLASALTRELAVLTGPGMGSYFFIKGVYAGFGVLLACGLFAWMRAEEHSPESAALIAVLGLATPAVAYVNGRAMGEILMLGICACGFALMRATATEELRGAEWKRGALKAAAAFSCFVLAYGARTTTFTLVGSFLLYDFLRRALEERTGGVAKALVSPRVWLSPAVVVGVAYAAAIGLMAWRLSVPVFPLKQAVSHMALYKPSPWQGVMTFYVLTASTGIVLVFGSLWLAAWRPFRVPLVLAWTWVLAAASPYLVLWIRGAYINPRQTVDLVLPVLGVLGVFARFPEANESRPSRGWLITAAVTSLVLLAAWKLGHPRVNNYLKWFTHDYNQLARWLHWFGFTLLAAAMVAGWVWAQARGGRRWWTLPSLLALGLALLMGQQHLASGGVGFSLTLVAPPRVSAFLEQSNVPEDAVLATALPHYEAEILMYTMPARAWQTHDAYNGLAALEPFARPEEDADWILLSRRALIDAPDSLERLLEEQTERRAADLVAQEGVWLLYRTR